MTQIITYKGYRGRYHTITKTFVDDRHFSNWYKMMTRKGCSIVGVYDTDN